MTYKFIQVKEAGGVLVITMDDPATRNAISTEMAREIGQELRRLEADPNLRTLVLTGRDPAFCSGANVKRMDQEAQERANEEPNPPHLSAWEYLDQRWEQDLEEAGQRMEDSEEVRFVPLKLHNLQKPSIAAINGHAMGLGMGIALSCDISIASDKARMAETFIRRGLIPGDGSCWQLPRIIGLRNTLLLQYTGDVLDANEALRLGIVNKVTPHEELMGTAMELAQRLAQGPTYTMALTKRLVHRSLEVDFRESLRLAGPAQDIARRTEDHREGTRAFVEKRPAQFRGR